MLNLDFFIKALKITCVDYKNIKACWIPLIPFNETALHENFYLAVNGLHMCCYQINNRFFQYVLNAWCELTDPYSCADMPLQEKMWDTMVQHSNICYAYFYTTANKGFSCLLAY